MKIVESLEDLAVLSKEGMPLSVRMWMVSSKRSTLAEDGQPEITCGLALLCADGSYDTESGIFVRGGKHLVIDPRIDVGHEVCFLQGVHPTFSTPGLAFSPMAADERVQMLLGNEAATASDSADAAFLKEHHVLDEEGRLLERGRCLKRTVVALRSHWAATWPERPSTQEPLLHTASDLHEIVKGYRHWLIKSMAVGTKATTLVVVPLLPDGSYGHNHERLTIPHSSEITLDPNVTAGDEIEVDVRSSAASFNTSARLCPTRVDPYLGKQLEVVSTLNGGFAIQASMVAPLEKESLAAPAGSDGTYHLTKRGEVWQSMHERQSRWRDASEIGQDAATGPTVEKKLRLPSDLVGFLERQAALRGNDFTAMSREALFAWAKSQGYKSRGMLPDLQAFMLPGGIGEALLAAIREMHPAQ